MKKALNAYRFYPPGHQKVNEFNETLLSCVRTLNGITLDVTVAGLLAGETVVLEGETIKDAPTRPLFLEGILRFSIAREVELHEIAELLRVWHAAIVRALPAGQTVTTLWWEASFRRIDIEFAELAGMQDLTDAETEREEKRKKVIDSLLSYMSVNKVSRPPRPTDFNRQKTQIEALTGLDLSRAGDFILPVPLSPAELTQVKTELRAAKGSNTVRLAIAAWEVFDATLDAERTLVAKWFGQALKRLSDEPLANLTDLVQRLSLSARLSSSGERLVDWLSALLKEPWSTLLLGKLENDDTAKEAEELIAQLPRALVAELLVLLPKLKSTSTRGRLVTHLVSRKVPSKALTTIAAQLKAGDVDWLKPLLENAPDGKPVLAELYRLAGPAFRIGALEQLPETAFATMKPLLVASIDSTDPKERLAAAKLVAELKVPAAEASVARALMASLGKPEAQAWMNILASFETLAALEGLSTYFNEEKDLALRISCVRVLGQVGSPRMLPMLTNASKGLFVNRRLKEACAEAIKAIQSGIS